MTVKNYDTVTEAIEGLKERGYTHDFAIADGEDCIVCHKQLVKLSPDEFKIDEYYRFEGPSDPGDEMIVYALSSDKFNIKGTIVNAFGIYADNIPAALIEKLSVNPKAAHAPLKRSKALIQFSRDHHFALLLVWKIRQGLKKDIPPDRISNYVQFYFDNALHEHFKREELELFARLREDDPLRLRAFSEHAKVYHILDQIKQDNANTSLLAELALAIETHIRFEERTLFNHLQSNLSKEAIQYLEEHPGIKQGDIDDDWKDHFWISNT